MLPTVLVEQTTNGHEKANKCRTWVKLEILFFRTTFFLFDQLDLTWLALSVIERDWLVSVVGSGKFT
jgi:hypothetical protein